tara:strand:- start:6 stop:698 length:693 start_codon:yes stop_codon:yes gene_type:complete
MLSEEKKEDFLEVDQPIAGQNYVCMSFISPENILKDKNMYYVQHFLKSFVNKLNIDFDLKLEYDNVKNEYDQFLFEHKDKMDKTFDEENNNQTSIRGVKIRGSYDSYREAEVRSKTLQKMDTSHNIFIGQVGYWLPWDPDPSSDKINSEYQEEQLNNLMKEYNNNQQQKDMFYQEQTKERSQKAKDQIDTDLSCFNGIFEEAPVKTTSETITVTETVEAATDEDKDKDEA